MIKRIASLILAFMAPAALFAAGGCLSYSPTDMGSVWHYKWFEKKNPSDVREFRAKIQYHMVISGMDYYCYYSPATNLKNVVRITEDGAYIRTIKFPVPVLSFLYVDVDLDPEVEFLKCPLKTGDKWEQDSKGTIRILGLFPVTRDVRARFEATGKDMMKIGDRDVEVYKLKTQIDDGSGKFEDSEQWYGKGVGYVREDNKYYNLMLQDYSIETAGK